MCVLLVLVTALLGPLSLVSSQTIISGRTAPGNVYVPTSPCPGTFEYVWWQNEVVGLAALTPPQRTSLRDPILLVVTLAMEFIIPQGYAGTVELYDSKSTVFTRLAQRDNTPILYRIRFPLRSPIAVLSSLELNGNVVCQGKRYTNSGVVTILTLHYSLLPDGGTALSSLPESQQQQPQQQLSQQQLSQQVPQYQQQQYQQYSQQPSRQTSPSSWTQTNRPSTRPVVTQTWRPQQNTPQPTWQPETLTTALRPRQTLSTSAPFVDSGCGRPVQQLSSILPLLLHGDFAEKGQWPWLVAIYIKTDYGQDFQCGGSLVSTMHVITAAHCIREPYKIEIRPENLIVFIGKYNLRKAEPDSQIRDVSSVALHPQYDAKKYVHDIAVTTLEMPIQFTPSVQPVCLWPESRIDLKHVVRKRGVVVGWGKDEKGNRVTDRPKMASMPLVSQEECLRSHPNFYTITSDNTFCAGDRNGTGPCNGDSGGGMFFKEPTADGSSRWMLRGIVSLSLQDEISRQCDLSKYIVFTDVAKYINWIKETMALNS